MDTAAADDDEAERMLADLFGGPSQEDPLLPEKSYLSGPEQPTPRDPSPLSAEDAPRSSAHAPDTAPAHFKRMGAFATRTRDADLRLQLRKY